PSAALAASTTYTATLTTGIQDANGIPVASNITWTFTTAASGGGGGPTGQLAYWAFDEGSGTSVADTSGSGTAANGTASNTTWTTGQNGSALSFNGSVVNIGDPSKLANKTAFSWAAWIYVTGDPGSGPYGAIMDKGAGSTQAKTFYVTYTTGSANLRIG